MAKIKLGSHPASFKRTVTFPMLDGTTGAIEWDFKYRTAKAFGQFQDEWRAKQEQRSEGLVKAKIAEYDKLAAQAKETGAEAPAPVVISNHEMQGQLVEAGAEYIMAIAQGWNLDEEFNLENVQQLCDEQPHARMAAIEDYEKALVGARLGN